jgi:hypothetical protein
MFLSVHIIIFLSVHIIMLRCTSTYSEPSNYRMVCIRAGLYCNVPISTNYSVPIRTHYNVPISKFLMFLSVHIILLRCTCSYREPSNYRMVFIRAGLYCNVPISTHYNVTISTHYNVPISTHYVALYMHVQGAI